MYKVYVTKKEVYACRHLHEAVEKVREYVNLENCDVVYSKGFNVLECTDNKYNIIVKAQL